MRKPLVIVVVAAVVAALGWTGIWFWGKGQVESFVERQIAALDRQGWSMTFDERRVEGFPGRYRISLGDVGLVERETGVLVRLQELTLTAMPVIDDRAELALTGTFSVMAPVTTAARMGNPNLPARMEVTGTSEGLTLVPSGGAARITARNLGLRLDQPDVPWMLDAEIEGLDLTLGGAGPRTLEISAGQIVSGIEDREVTDFRDMRLRHRDVAISAEFSARDLTDLVNGVLGDRDSWAKGRFSIGPFEMVLRGPGPDGADTTTTVTDQGTTGTFELGKGIADYRIETRDLAAVLDVAAPGSTDAPVAVRVSAASYARELRVPFAAARSAPQLAELRLDLGEITGDAAFWSVFDPSGALDRPPGALKLAVDATVLARDGLLPTELSNIMVGTLSVAALGAEASAEGDLEVLQPANIAEGTLDVRGTGLREVLGDLRRAGLIDAETEETGDAILKVYARPGAEPDQWESDITFRPSGMTVNGLPVQ